MSETTDDECGCITVGVRVAIGVAVGVSVEGGMDRGFKSIHSLHTRDRMKTNEVVGMVKYSAKQKFIITISLN